VVFKHRCFANAQSTGVIGRGIRFTKALPLIGGEEGVYCTHVVQWVSGFSTQVDATAGQGQQGSDAGESQHLFASSPFQPSKENGLQKVWSFGLIIFGDIFVVHLPLCFTRQKKQRTRTDPLLNHG
jgi:hypothetical protein